MQESELSEIMHTCGMPDFGVSPFDALKDRLIPCRAKRRLPDGAKSVIAAIFPYYYADAGENSRYEISRYAWAADYHTVAGAFLARAAALLHDAYAEYRFEPFCDASPIPEVLAARLAGLGAVGQNGLLITPRYGSFVFIGEIVTDLALSPCEKPGGSCLGCGQCLAACPARSGLQDESGSILACPEQCVSRLTQQKGTLTPAQRGLIKKAGFIWGCDICQNICPMNRAPAKTNIDAFKINVLKTLTLQQVEDDRFTDENAGRAFLWRGKAVLARNIGIVHGQEENTNGVGKI